MVAFFTKRAEVGVRVFCFLKPAVLILGAMFRHLKIVEVSKQGWPHPLTNTELPIRVHPM